MLAAFRSLAEHEKILDSYGRNSANTVKSRSFFAMNAWNDILDIATKTTEIWSKQTPLGQAVRYIKKNFEKHWTFCRSPVAKKIKRKKI